MNSVVVANQVRLRQAASMVRACSESGMPVKEWLQENGVSKYAYYYWKRKLKDVCLDELGPSFVELPAASESEHPGPSDKEAISATMRIGNRTVEIYDSATAGFLENLLKAAGHA